METKILEEFIKELKQIVPDNNASFNPNLMRSQVFVIDEIIKMAEEKVKTNKSKEKPFGCCLRIKRWKSQLDYLWRSFRG